MVCMDILASMLAYLGCVSGIVAALAMSFFVVFSTPVQFTTVQPPATHTAAVAGQLSAPNSATATVAEAKPASTIGPWQGDVVSLVAKREPPPETSGTPITIAVDARQKETHSAAQLRRLAREERTRRLAYRQDPDFETRFLSYAD